MFYSDIIQMFCSMFEEISVMNDRHYPENHHSSNVLKIKLTEESNKLCRLLQNLKFM